LRSSAWRLPLSLLKRVGRDHLIFGHRGVPHEAPENTVASFRRAVELGLDGVELDVQQCKSGELVVFHDDEVDKLTDGSGNVAELAFDELRKLDAGVRFKEKFRGERIPSLDEVLEVLRGTMIINIELKSESIRDNGFEEKVVTLIGNMGLQSTVILSSFNPFSVGRVIGARAGLTTGLLFAEDQSVYLRQAWGSYLLKINGLHPRYPLVTEKLMRRARKRNWFVSTWTVDDAHAAERLFEAGVDIVITNHPERLCRALETEKENL